LFFNGFFTRAALCNVDDLGDLGKLQILEVLFVQEGGEPMLAALHCLLVVFANCKTLDQVRQLFCPRAFVCKSFVM
jgi:hypothetical protein